MNCAPVPYRSGSLSGPPVGAVPSKGYALGQLFGNYPVLAQVVNVINEAAPGVCAIVVLPFAASSLVGPFGVRIPKSVSNFCYGFHVVGFLWWFLLGEFCADRFNLLG